MNRKRDLVQIIDTDGKTGPISAESVSQFFLSLDQSNQKIIGYIDVFSDNRSGKRSIIQRLIDGHITNNRHSPIFCPWIGITGVFHDISQLPGDSFDSPQIGSIGILQFDFHFIGYRIILFDFTFGIKNRFFQLRRSQLSGSQLI